MYDLWYVLGRAIMDNGLLTAVQNAGPTFDHVIRKITETDAASNITFEATKADTAGLLSEVPTLAVRSAIWQWLVANPLSPANPTLPPPISINTAGRFCQFAAVGSMAMGNRLSDANQAYTASLQGADPTTFFERFPAFLGACLLDPDLAGKVITPTNADSRNAITQFGANAASPEYAVLSRTVNHNSFITAQGQLLNDLNGDWSGPCGEQFNFWSEKNERAVL